MYYGWTVKVHLTQYSECLLGLLFFFSVLGLPFDIFWLVFHRSSLVHLHLQQCFQRYRAAPVSISCPGICIYWGTALFVMPLGELCCSFMASVLHFASEPALSLSYRIDLFAKINPRSWCTPDKTSSVTKERSNLPINLSQRLPTSVLFRYLSCFNSGLQTFSRWMLIDSAPWRNCFCFSWFLFFLGFFWLCTVSGPILLDENEGKLAQIVPLSCRAKHLCWESPLRFVQA